MEKLVKWGSKHDRVICNLDNGAMRCYVEENERQQRESKLYLGEGKWIKKNFFNENEHGS